MFRVDNVDFIADKLAAELLPDQEYREAFKNAEEAIGRRLEALPSESTGRILFDVDWHLLSATGNWYIACSDDGDGMSRSELARYMTTLAVQGASGNQSLTGNQGMGLKISGPTRHRRGLLIRSMQGGECWMLQVGWDGKHYGLIPLGADGETVVPVDDESFPEHVRAQGSGTVVTFLGNADDENTFVPQGKSRGWLFRYLNQRFYRLSAGRIEAFVRVPTGDVDEWPQSAEEAAERQRGVGGRTFNLSRVKGTASVWDDAADHQATDPSARYRGSVDLHGDATADIPEARMHWWILPSGPGTDVSSRTASGGSIAVLFQNELHDWRTSVQANSYFARLGVLFGKARIGFVLEPLGSTIASDFARAHVLVGGRSVFESDAWQQWSEQFRLRMPDEIKQTMAEEQARLQEEDPDRARRIRDRLRDILQLLRPRRFKRDEDGGVRAAGPFVVGPGDGAGGVMARGVGPRRRSAGARGIGSVLSQLGGSSSEVAREVFSMLQLDPKWIGEADADNLSIVNGDASGLRDRAAALAGEDGATAGVLLLNRDFRGYRAIVATVNDWANADGDEAKGRVIEDQIREWIEQKMVEAVIGLRQLENGSTWLSTNFDDALSPSALTAVFMADRYHTLREVRRQVGALRTTAGSGVA